MATGGEKTDELILCNALLIHLNHRVVQCNVRDSNTRKRLEEDIDKRHAICGVIYPYNGNKDEAVVVFNRTEDMNVFIKNEDKNFGDIKQVYHQTSLENGDIQTKSASNGSTLEVDKYIFNDILDLYEAELDKIKTEHKVTLKITDSADQQKYLLEVNAIGNVEAAVERLLDLYQGVATTTDEYKLPIPDEVRAMDTYEFETMVKEIKRKFHSIVIRKVQNSIALSGNHKEIGSALDAFHNYIQRSSTRHEPGAASSFEKFPENRDNGLDFKESGKGLIATQGNAESVLEIYKDEFEKLKKRYHFEITLNAQTDKMVHITLKSNGNAKFVDTDAENAFINFFQKHKKNIRSVTAKIPDDLEKTDIDKVISAMKQFYKNIIFQTDVSLMEVNIVGNVDLVDKARDKLCKKFLDYSDQASPKMNKPVASTTRESSMSRTMKPKHDKGDDCCPICMDEFVNKTTLDKCKHSFCKDCLDQAMKAKSVCPICQTVYGKLVGNQPKNARMSHTVCSRPCLPGYERCGTITIFYDIPYGIQGEEHPNPGRHYHGTTRTAYLPDSPEGRHVLSLLKKAFDQRLIFTIGTSTTSGLQDSVTWNDIHHKTSMYGGPNSYGYPDPDYLNRVKDELKCKGIV